MSYDLTLRGAGRNMLHAPVLQRPVVLQRTRAAARRVARVAAAAPCRRNCIVSARAGPQDAHRDGGREGAHRPGSHLRALADPPQGGAAAVEPPAQEPVNALLSVLWERFVRPLRDFGFGRKSIWEGGVGLFIIGGLGLVGLVISWIRGINFHKARTYQAVMEFPQACGIQIGTPVRVRGVRVGSVLGVKPSLERVDVMVEVDNVAYKIPRNSLIEANQSGLIAETLIDITPRLPIPQNKFGPLDAGCAEEGVVVCDKGRIVGKTGVSMDALVAVCTKLALEMDELGALKLMHSTATDVQRLLSDVKPLVAQAEAIAAEVKPLLSGVREGELLASVERLAESAAATAADVRKLNAAVLTEENTELLRQSVGTLTKTLQHVEAISGDVGSMTGDPSTRQNLRQLIQSLSRLLAD